MEQAPEAQEFADMVFDTMARMDRASRDALVAMLRERLLPDVPEAQVASGELRCPVCGSAFSALTGTVLEYSKKELPVWERFITCMCYNAPLDLIAEVCEVTHKTAFEWRHRVFATVDGYQDRLALSGRVWIDELYLTDSDIVRSADFVQKRGLSKNKICIAVGVDESGRSVFVNEGKGMTTTERTWAALGTRIARGTHVVHDMETAHNKLVRELKLVSETHNGKALMGVPDKQNPLQPVNHMCFLLKAFLRAHSGFSRDDLDGYLNLFHVMMNDPADKMEEAFNQCPSLRSKYADQVRLWRMGIAM